MSQRVLLTLAAVLLLLGSCEQVAPPPSIEPAINAVSESALGMMVVRADRAEMSAVDLIEVHVVVQHRAGIIPGDIEFVPQASGWTVTEVRRDRPRHNGENIEQRAIWVLEPFLPGDYELPSARVVLRASDGRESALATPAQTIRVLSALEASDSEELAPPRLSLKSEPAPAASRSPLIAIAITCLGAALVGVGVVARIKRRRREDRPVPASPVAVLSDERATNAEFARAARLLVYRRLTGTIDDRVSSSDIAMLAKKVLPPGASAEVSQLMGQLDEMAYGGVSSDRARLRAHVVALVDADAGPEVSR